MAKAAFRRAYRTPGPFACLAATPNDDALRTCAIFDCGRPPQARAGKGMSLYHCKWHIQKRNRHGSFWKGTYSAAQLKDYRRAAERYLKAHLDDFWIAAALTAIRATLEEACEHVMTEHLAAILTFKAEQYGARDMTVRVGKGV